MIGKKPKSNPLAGQLVDLEGSPLASWLTGWQDAPKRETEDFSPDFP